MALVWALMAAAAQIQCVDAARAGARAAARTEPRAATLDAARSAAPSGAEVTVGRSGDLWHVRVTAPVPGPRALAITLSAEAVAAAEDVAPAGDLDDPAGTATPVAPVEPMGPAAPAALAASTGPVGPATPLASTAPVEPTAPREVTADRMIPGVAPNPRGEPAVPGALPASSGLPDRKVPPSQGGRLDAMPLAEPPAPAEPPACRRASATAAPAALARAPRPSERGGGPNEQPVSRRGKPHEQVVARQRGGPMSRWWPGNGEAP
ncbi:TadE family type IV pilus minor pilin [Streptomyces fuscigenes]|uniref:TadE family type IV pilus minor pilin n=1 Tax=Streptomyces fuscigenes TaxID=1528880 RepID=UPI003558DEDD